MLQISTFITLLNVLLNKSNCLVVLIGNIMVTWSKLFGLPYLIQIMQFCGSLSKFVGQTSQLFQENMEDKFNKDMSCITHFVLIHAILRTSQMLLVFSRH